MPLYKFSCVFANIGVTARSLRCAGKRHPRRFVAMDATSHVSRAIDMRTSMVLQHIRQTRDTKVLELCLLYCFKYTHRICRVVGSICTLSLC